MCLCLHLLLLVEAHFILSLVSPRFFRQFAVTYLCRHKASTPARGMDESMISETPHWAHSHTHSYTQIACRQCQSFFGLLCYTSSPMAGMTICLHVATLVGVCVFMWICMHASCACVYHATLQSVISQCVHVSCQAEREAASRFCWANFKLWTQ